MAEAKIASIATGTQSNGDHLHFPSIKPMFRSLVQGREGARLQLVTLCVSLLPALCLVSVVAETVWKPLPFPQAANLYVLNRSVPLLEEADRDARRLAEAAPAIESAGLFTSGDGGLQPQAGASQRTRFAVVSRHFFHVLGITPMAGRIPEADEVADSPGRPVVISQRLFQWAYGSSPSAVGQSCVINGVPGRIAAVVRTQDVLLPGVDVWVIRQRREDGMVRGALAYSALIRLRSDTAPRTASEQIAAAMENGDTNDRAGRPTVAVIPLRTYLYRDHQTALMAAAWVVGSLFFIGLINSIAVYTFELLRSQRDMALRLALGSSFKQLALEIVVRQQVYATCGWLLAALLCPLFAAGIADFEGLAPSGFSHQWPTVVALLASWVVAVAAASVVALAQLWIIRRVNLLALLQDNSRSASGSRQGRRVQNSIVFLQLTVTLAMLITASRVTYTYWITLKTDLGMSAANVLVFDVESPAAADTPERKRLMLRRFLTTLSSQLPVEWSGAVNYLPLDSKQSILLIVEPAGGSGSTAAIPAGFRVVEGDYFQSLGIRLLDGRMFDSRVDREAGPCALLINTALARQLGPGIGAPGQNVRIPGLYDRCKIVGVVGAVRHQGPSEPPSPEFYLPFDRMPSPFMTAVVKLRRPVTEVLADARTAARISGAGLSISEPRAMLSLLDELVHSQRSQAVTLCLVAAIAFLLTQLGLYGLVSRTIAGEARRIAIEMALGAPTWSILWGRLKWILGVIVISAVAGNILAAVASIQIAGLSRDVWVAFAITLLIAAVSVLSVVISAGRVVRQEPGQVLKWSGL